ncbi:hypothetical protein ACFSR7_01920 [Cohnella sp. GCM10020058]|uniref:hypothetical protein n=1 Tax=Cohnella sp. GCM10020058 TaxID=3317330 RepID=UPI00362A044A
MLLESFSSNLLIKLQKQLDHSCLCYGEGFRYNSLLTPTTTIIESNTASNIDEDLKHLWNLYRILNDLYIDSRGGRQPTWITKLVEHGVTSTELEVHQIISEARLEPRMCRIDYVTLGKDERQIAEVQWKSGGPGLFFGIQREQSLIIPNSSNTRTLGNLAEGFADAILESGADPVAINDVRHFWMNGENYLKNYYEKKGIAYFPIERSSLETVISLRNEKVLLNDENGSRPLTFLYGQEFTSTLDHELLIKLARESIEGKLWVETPMNVIYRQKWGMSIPFMDEYKDLFSNRLREIIIPTVLIQAEQINLKPILNYLPDSLANHLESVKSIYDLAMLPESIRGKLIIKCGGGAGAFYNRSRGVFRLTGSKKSAKQILDLVLSQVHLGEPWIIQPYVDQTVAVPLSHPENSDDIEVSQCHARYMIFGRCLSKTQYKVIGGLGNYSKHWKVNGHSAQYDKLGRLEGSAFNEIRVGQPQTIGVEELIEV